MIQQLCDSKITYVAFGISILCLIMFFISGVIYYDKSTKSKDTKEKDKYKNMSKIFISMSVTSFVIFVILLILLILCYLRTKQG